MQTTSPHIVVTPLWIELIVLLQEWQHSVLSHITLQDLSRKFEKSTQETEAKELLLASPRSLEETPHHPQS